MLLAKIIFYAAAVVATAPMLPPELLRKHLPAPDPDTATFWVVTQAGPVRFSPGMTFPPEGKSQRLFCIVVWESRVMGCYEYVERSTDEQRAVSQAHSRFARESLRPSPLSPVLGRDYQILSVREVSSLPKQR